MKEKNPIPLGERTILKVRIIREVKTIQDAQGNSQKRETTDISRDAKVVATNHPELKKGDLVYYNPRGVVNIELAKTSKEMLLAVDNDDVYVLLK
jgi:hypothetical protein